MSGILMPQTRDTSLTSTLLKGLQAAQAVIGIRKDLAETDALQAKETRADEAQSGTVAEAERMKRGELTPTEAADMAAKGNLYDAPGPNRQQVTIGPPGVGKIAFIGAPQEKAAFHPPKDIPNFRDPKTGKIGTALVDASGNVTGFVPQEKPAPTDRTLAIDTVDAAGNPIKKIVPNVAGAEYPTMIKGSARDLDTQFNKLTDEIKGSVRDSIGGEKTKLRNSTHGLSLLTDEDGKPVDINKLNYIQIKELAGVLAQQVTAGSPAERTLSEMTPKTAVGDLAKAWSYITGGPVPADQGEFVAQLRDMIARQQATSLEIIGGELGPIIGNFKGLRAKDAERYDRILAGAGIQVDDNGNITAFRPKYVKDKPKEKEKVPSGTAVAAPPAAKDHPEAGAAEKEARRVLADPQASAEDKSVATAVLDRLGVK